jgi:hypothetical protein
LNIDKQKRIALAIMQQKFAENANLPQEQQEKFFEGMMDLALKADIPYGLALEFVESLPQRSDVALAILQQTFLEFGMGPGHIARIHALAEKVGVSYCDSRDFVESVIAAKVAEAMEYSKTLVA